MNCHFPYECRLLKSRYQSSEGEYLRVQVIRYSLADLRGTRADRSDSGRR
jgi:hypothetical protein